MSAEELLQTLRQYADDAGRTPGGAAAREAFAAVEAYHELLSFEPIVGFVRQASAVSQEAASNPSGESPYGAGTMWSRPTWIETDADNASKWTELSKQAEAWLERAGVRPSPEAEAAEREANPTGTVLPSDALLPPVTKPGQPLAPTKSRKGLWIGLALVGLGGLLLLNRKPETELPGQYPA